MAHNFGIVRPALSLYLLEFQE